MTKVIVVGLDGADPNLINLWSKHLPNLRRIMKNGVYGNLESTIPAATVPAWDCFSTGKNPGKIGVFWFVNLKADGSVRIVDSTLCDSPRFWEILSQFGKRVGVLNVPGTYPPAVVKGFMVSGCFTPLSSNNYTQPLKLREELDKVVNGYETDVVRTNPKYMKGGEEEFLGEIERVHFKRLKVTKYLMKKYDWSFFIVVFRAVDLVQHHFWHYFDEKHSRHDPTSHRYRNVIRDWYQKMDEAIGQIMETIDNETYLFIMSDHGCGPSNSCFYINEWLRQEGLLKLKPNSRLTVTPTYLPQFKNLLFKYLSPGTIKKLLRVMPRFLVQKGTTRGLSKNSIEKMLSEIDWSATDAFALGGPSSNIYLNVRGRIPKGLLKSGKEYEEIRNKIINRLRQINHTATGESVSNYIYKKEELYWGKHSDIAPDLSVEFFTNGSRCTVYESIGHGKLWAKSPTSGAHLRDGIWMLIGPQVRKKKMDAKIIDLAPTILYLLNVPVLKDMDGKVLRQALSITKDIKYQEFSTPTTKTQEYSTTEKEELEEKLRGLGYFD